MQQTLRLMGGFAALTMGALLTIPLPELGIPLVLLGTRLLGGRYRWADALNSRVDVGWTKTRTWIRRQFAAAAGREGR